MSTFGSWLRGLREEAGVPLRVVAAAAEMDQSLLGHIERGHRLPTEVQADRLAVYFEQDPKHFQALRLAAELQEHCADPEILQLAGQLVAEPSKAFRVNKSVKSRGKAVSKKE
ncbi:helix-turn-helix domain-containing protein [Cerasicoccus frondis]|uniref:helix-turn-helix domain-containing protein n=1 Tax=Cerasicoccus frondis TaxID=490090 RepID=UPI002852880B|nr:helix-turn-helix transcriptional regulator [Cerasicoccus frondis]